MLSRYDRIFLSPHLDDAVLSCGGRLAMGREEGLSALVVSVATAEPTVVPPFAQHLHDFWKLEAGSVVADRLREEVAACDLLGADCLFLDELDCIYRVHPHHGDAFYNSGPAVMGDIPSADRAMVAVLARHFLALPPAKEVYVPLGAGNHVDHRLTRLAAEQCFGSTLRYYEDYPYVQFADVLSEALGDEGDWRCEVLPMTQQMMAAKLAAIRCYPSQLQALFKGRDDFEIYVRAYATDVGGERTWIRN